MKLDYLLAMCQYLACVVTGYLYFVGIATVLGVAAGFGPLALFLLFLSLLLAGFVSGISLFRPLIGSGLAIAAVIPFIVTAVYSVMNDIPASEPEAWLVPGSIVILISTLNLLITRHSPWQGPTPLRFLVVVLALAPALIGVLLLLSIVFWMASLDWKWN
jgi:hypothetical protein